MKLKLSHKLLRRNLILSTKRNLYDHSGLNYNKKSWWNNEIIFNTFYLIIFKITNDNVSKRWRITCCQKLFNLENFVIKICKNSLRTMGVLNNYLSFIPFKETVTKLQYNHFREIILHHSNYGVLVSTETEIMQTNRDVPWRGSIISDTT